MLEYKKEKLIIVDPIDIIVLILGSMCTSMQTGSNKELPPLSSLS